MYKLYINFECKMDVKTLNIYCTDRKHNTVIQIHGPQLTVPIVFSTILEYRIVDSINNNTTMTI